MESYWKMTCSEDGRDSKVSPGRDKMKPAVMALRLNRGEKGLSLYGNGRLVDKIVASTSPDSEHTCLVSPLARSFSLCNPSRVLMGDGHSASSISC